MVRADTEKYGLNSSVCAIWFKETRIKTLSYNQTQFERK